MRRKLPHSIALLEQEALIVKHLQKTMHVGHFQVHSAHDADQVARAEERTILPAG